MSTLYIKVSHLETPNFLPCVLLLSPRVSGCVGHVVFLSATRLLAMVPTQKQITHVSMLLKQWLKPVYTTLRTCPLDGFATHAAVPNLLAPLLWASLVEVMLQLEILPPSQLLPCQAATKASLSFPLRARGGVDGVVVPIEKGCTRRRAVTPKLCQTRSCNGVVRVWGVPA